MKNLFEWQISHHNIVTEEVIEKLKVKTYKNGDEIKVGDKVLYALLTDMSEEMIKAKGNWSDMPMERTQEPNPISLELITLNESQFDLYTYDDRLQDKTGEQKLPIIRLK